MKYISQGNQSLHRLQTLLRATDIRSESIIKGLTYHLVDGHPLAQAALLVDVPKGNLSRAVNALNNFAEIHEELKEIDGCKKVL